MSPITLSWERGRDFLADVALSSGNGLFASAILGEVSLVSGGLFGVAYAVFEYAFTSSLQGSMERSQALRIAKYALQILGGLCFASVALSTFGFSLAPDGPLEFSFWFYLFSLSLQEAISEAITSRRHHSAFYSTIG